MVLEEKILSTIQKIKDYGTRQIVNSSMSGYHKWVLCNVYVTEVVSPLLPLVTVKSWKFSSLDFSSSYVKMKTELLIRECLIMAVFVYTI